MHEDPKTQIKLTDLAKILSDQNRVPNKHNSYEPGRDIDTEQNFKLFQARYLKTLQQAHPTNWREHLNTAREFVKTLNAFVVSTELHVESILKLGLLPYSDRPIESRKRGGILPEDGVLNAERYVFGTLGKPQERCKKGERVVIVIDPVYTEFFTMNDVLKYDPKFSRPMVDWGILNNQKMHKQHLVEHFALMIAIAYDNPSDFLTRHDKYVPALPYSNERFCPVEVELRLSKICSTNFIAIIIENPNFQEELIKLGFPKDRIIIADGEDFRSSFALAEFRRQNPT